MLAFALAVTLSWVQPNEYEGDAPLDPANIQQSTIYCDGVKVMDVLGSASTVDNVPDCPSNFYSVTVTVNGTESAKSGLVLIERCGSACAAPEPPPITYSVKPFTRLGVSYPRKLYHFVDGVKVEPECSPGP